MPHTGFPSSLGRGSSRVMEREAETSQAGWSWSCTDPHRLPGLCQPPTPHPSIPAPDSHPLGGGSTEDLSFRLPRPFSAQDSRACRLTTNTGDVEHWRHLGNHLGTDSCLPAPWVTVALPPLAGQGQLPLQAGAHCCPGKSLGSVKHSCALYFLL